MKLGVLFFLLLFATAFVSGKSISISPNYLEFEFDKNFMQCKNITIDYDGILQAEDRWSKKESKNLQDYNYNSNYFGLRLHYTKFTNEKNHEICISGKPGIYYGAILYKEDYLGMGSWIKVNITGERENISYKVNKITGNAVNSENYNFYLGFGIWMLILMSFLLYLILKLKKHNFIYRKRDARLQTRLAG